MIKTIIKEYREETLPEIQGYDREVVYNKKRISVNFIDIKNGYHQITIIGNKEVDLKKCNFRFTLHLYDGEETLMEMDYDFAVVFESILNDMAFAFTEYRERKEHKIYF